MKKYIQNHFVKIWLGLQVLLLLLIACHTFSQARTHYEPRVIDPQNSYYMTMGTYLAEKNGYYVDELTGTEGVFTCGPYITLPKGIYDITLFYESTGEGHVCYAFSEDSEFYAKGILGDKVSLDSNHTSKHFRIKVGRGCNDFEVQTYYSGNGSLLVKGYTIEQGLVNTLNETLHALLFVLVLNLIALFLYRFKTGRLSGTKLLTFGTLAGILLFSSLPLLKEGFPRYTTDLNFILMRIEGLKDGLLSGDFPVRIQPNWLNGYGYATSIFYSDFFLYLPALLRMAGISVQNAYFAYQFCINIATCLLAYYCFKGIFRDRIIALVGTGLYALSTYRLLLLYYTTRGGMFTAYTFLPLILYGVYLIYTDSSNYRSWLLTALGMTGIIRSHLLSAEMVAVTLFLCILLSAKRFFRKGALISMLKAVVVSIGLNLSFFLPMLDYMGDGFYVSSEDWKKFYNYIQNDGLKLSGFLDVFRGIDSYHAPDMILIVATLCFLLLLFIMSKKEFSDEMLLYRQAGALGLVLSVILCFMSTKYFPWDAIEESYPALRMPINSIQYPHRFVEIAILTMTFTTCCGLVLLKQKMSKENYHHVLFGLCIVLFITSGWMMSSILNLDTYHSVYDCAYLDTCRISTKEYLPEGANPDFYTNEFPLAESGIEIQTFDRRGLHLSLTCDNQSGKDSLIELPLVYYNGYQAVTDSGEQLTLWCSDTYTIQVVVPKDYSGDIDIAFKSPLMWTVGLWCSILCVIGCGVVVIRNTTTLHSTKQHVL